MAPETSHLLDLLRHGNQLKRTNRTGWVQRGVPDAENVAAHSYGVAYAVLVLAPAVDKALDLGRALALALLHDLPEGLTSDIPSPAGRFLPEGAKAEIERRALEEIVGETAIAPDWRDLLEELWAGETAEAQLVHDADKIDLYLQAAAYETETGNRRLAEFWSKPASFYFPAAQAVYELVLESRSQVNE